MKTYTRSIEPIVALPPKEETRLFEAAKSGDVDSRNTLLEHYYRFAVFLTAKIVAPGSPRWADACSAAMTGLLKAVQAFDPARKIRFTTFSGFYISGAVRSFLRKEGSRREVPEADMQAGASGRESSSEAQVPHYLLSMAALAGDTNASDPVYTEVAQNDAEANQHSLLEKAKAECLSAEERALVEAHFDSEDSFAELGRRAGLTREAMRVRCRTALEKLRVFLTPFRQELLP